MKKIIFNEVTKELDLVDKEVEEETKENRIMRLKYFLEENKIFYDTIMTFLFTVLGIIISIIGVKLNINMQEISEKQLEITKKESIPYFSLDYQERNDQIDESDEEKSDESDEEESLESLKYQCMFKTFPKVRGYFMIKNQGGYISNATAKLITFEEFYLKDKRIRIWMQEEWGLNWTSYDENNKVFRLPYLYFDDYLDQIEDELYEKYGEEINLYEDLYVEIEYYADKKRKVYFKVDLDEMTLRKNEDGLPYGDVIFALYNRGIDYVVGEIDKVINSD